MNTRCPVVRVTDVFVRAHEIVAYKLDLRDVGYPLVAPVARRNLNEWVPAWCFTFIHWSLRNHGGRCPLKLDWFAVRGLRAENPTVVHDLAPHYGVPLSDHYPIAIDLVL